MDLIILLIIAIIALGLGVTIGYLARQSIVKKRAGNIESKLHQKVEQVKQESTAMLKNAQEKSAGIIKQAEKEIDERRRDFLKSQQILLDREHLLDKKISTFDVKEEEFRQKVEKVKEMKESLEGLRSEAEEKLEKIAKISRDEAKKELLALVEIEAQKELMEKERLKRRAQRD